MNKVYFSEIEGRYSFEIPREGFTINDSNSEFSDGFFVNWSYPVTIYMTESLKRTFGDLTSPNIILNRIFDNGYLNIEGTLHLCKLRFMSVEGEKLKIQFEFGIENLPSFDVPLKELELERVESSNIYDYVDEISTKSYPNTNVIFPMIHTEFLKDSEEKSLNFRHIYNDRNNGEIKKNSIIDTGFSNENILKPFVPLMHVLKSGFSRDGYTLEGDILEDDDFKNSYLNHSCQIHYEYKQELKETTIMVDEKGDEYDGPYEYSIPTLNHFVASKTINATYNILGNYYLSILTSKEGIILLKCDLTWVDDTGENQSINLFYQENEALAAFVNTEELQLSELLPPFNKDTEVSLNIYMKCILHTNVEMGQVSKTVSVYLNPKREEGSENETLTLFQHKNEFALSECMPDLTFGDLLSILKIWKNYKLKPKGNIIYMDRIPNFNLANVVDLSYTEQKNVEINFNQKEAFLLKLEVPENSTPQVYTITKDVLYESEKTFKNREDIVINGYPLPLKIEHDILTANEETQEVKGLHLIKYTGNNQYKTESLESLDLSNIYDSFYRIKIKNRLEAQSYRWSYIGGNKELTKLNSGDIIYAYNHYHKIINLQKKMVAENLYQITFETENRF